MTLGKRGAVNWTVGKLINIVLLVLVMALVIFGLTTGGLNPLIENVEAAFDEVLIMLPSWLGGVSSEECFFADVDELGGGKVFLGKVGLSGSDVGMNVCRNRMCNFTGGLEEYRNFKGFFEKKNGEEWGRASFFSLEKIDAMKFNWELYNIVSDVLEDAEGLDFIINPAPTRGFILHGEARGWFDSSVSAVWQDNVWVIVEEGEKDYVTENDDEAINSFVSRVDDDYDDKVTYDDGSGNIKEIWELVGGGNDELDSVEEREKLKTEFAKWKNEHSPHLSEEAVANLTKIISEHGKFVVDEKMFDAEVKEVGGELVIVLVSEGFRFGMKYATGENYEDVADCDRSSLPFILVEWDGSWKNRDSRHYYKLEEACLENMYRESLAANFLHEKCR